MTEPRFFQRELSWLAFNRRVLEEAQDDRNPLLERARFLGIVSSNLDEFCMVRLPGLHGLVEEADPDFSGMDRGALLDEVYHRLRRQSADQCRCWNQQLLPALADSGLRIVPVASCSPEERLILRVHYRDRIEPVLTPLAVDPARPFPILASGAVNVVVSLRQQDDPRLQRAVVAVPPQRRLIALPGGDGRHVLLEDVIAAFLGELFAGYEVVDSGLFRITRDGSLDIDEDQTTDLLSEIEEELRHRAFGTPMRLELSDQTSADLRSWLQRVMEIDDHVVVPVSSPLDLTFLGSLDRYLDDPSLRFPSFTPFCPQWGDAFAAIAARNRLLHHPYDSFQPVIDLVEQAAADDQVLAIKQTLYRVSGSSPIIAALARAARSGKQVTVLVELKARFDEQRNIHWARHLEKSGVHVIYGLVGFKVHSKLLLIIRREAEGIRRYCHIGTGNYNDRTAAAYTDLSYFTSHETVGREVAMMFNQLTGFAIVHHWERLIPAPVAAREEFTELIRAEAVHARAGREARITACFNSLFDDQICEELYAASQAGVAIDLIVRGFCILRPGVPGLSDNIRVRSIVGRYLEHSRIFRFEHGGDRVYVIGSADWMRRNLSRRVECLVRLIDPALRRRLDDILERMLSDNRSARTLRSDGVYQRLYPGPDEDERCVQVELMRRSEQLAKAEQSAVVRPRSFQPLRGHAAAITPLSSR